MKRQHKVPYQRKKTGKTDYRRRLRLLSSREPRLVIRPSNKNITIQIINHKENGDLIAVSVSSKNLVKDYQWKLCRGNVPCAYLTGLIAGGEIAGAGIKSAILDIKSSTKGSKVYAALKGVVDAGIIVPHKKEMLPC